MRGWSRALVSEYSRSEPAERGRATSTRQHFEVDDIWRPEAVEQRQDIVDDRVEHSLPHLHHHTVEMRGHDDVREFQQTGLPKPPLQPGHVWLIRAKLQLERRTRDLALFNLAIDSKLRGCRIRTELLQRDGSSCILDALCLSNAASKRG